MNFTPTEQSIFRLHDGDILVTEGSGSIRAVGASAVWHSELDGPVCFQNTLLRLRPREGTDGRYLAWWCRHAFADGLFASIATGANIFHLSAERVRTLPMIDRALEEQRAIADYLDHETARIDALIAAKHRLVGTLTEQIAAHRDRWYRELARQWTPVPLRRALLRLEQGWSPQCDNVPAIGDEWGVLKTSAVTGGRFRPDENKRLPASVEPDPRWIVREDDLLIVRGSGSANAVGQAAVVGCDAKRLLLSDLIYRAHLSSWRPTYVAEVLGTPQVRAQLQSAIRTDVGQTLKVRGDDLRELLVPSVPSHAQPDAIKRLHAVLDPIQQALTLLARSTMMLGVRSHALITAAVTGELPVRVPA